MINSFLAHHLTKMEHRRPVDQGSVCYYLKIKNPIGYQHVRVNVYVGQHVLYNIKI